MEKRALKQNPQSAASGISARAIVLAALGLLLLGFFLFNLERFFPNPSQQFTPPPQPIRVDIDTSRGIHPGAPLTLIEFSDFQCPFCNAALPVIRELEERYGDQLNVVIAHFPIAELHPDAPKAAEAAECARAQGKFQEYHNVLFQNQEDLSTSALLQYARVLELDESAFTRCLTSGEMRAAVEADVRAGLAAGVQGTPTFFANGIKIEGVQPTSSFTLVFDAAQAGESP